MGRRRGTALVEFALVFPLFAGVLLGIADIAYLYNHQLVLTNAAREGARLGALGRTSGDVRQAVLTYLSDSGYQPLPPAANVAVAIAGDTSSVTLRSDVPTLFGTGGPSLALHAAAKMHLETSAY